ncbi:prolyl-tRNA synthetase protein [Rutstroemia sp. NJR-2017a BBW]|nr:prolyl-tRNA synthetase protein [Rutstroemia sp. NJR-2017a BBW]
MQNSFELGFCVRKEVGYLLAPTHEEEITDLVANTVKSYKELPVRLYQIGRKYRDELRPRHGLLRSREFVMKDLYTFDYNAPLALETYEDVRKVYKNLFDELKIPYLVAEADSGDMGGNLSHEFHFPTSKGEDHVINCANCDYVANEELAVSGAKKKLEGQGDIYIHRGISKDKNTLINVWYWVPPGHSIDVNLHAIKALVPQYDASIEVVPQLWAKLTNSSDEESGRRTLQLVNLIDGQVPSTLREKIKSMDSSLADLFRWPWLSDGSVIFKDDQASPSQLQRIKDGDVCIQCKRSTLKVRKAIELGHTFHLGTRYSEPMNATIDVPSELVKDGKVSSEAPGSLVRVPMEMGCHGVGVTRMIGAVAETLADKQGLNWPRVMAPFEVVVVTIAKHTEAAEEVYDALTIKPRIDAIIDDRTQSFAWKMGDADLVGYPVIVVVGKKWKKFRMCEVQSRRLNVQTDVAFEELPAFVAELLSRL